MTDRTRRSLHRSLLWAVFCLSLSCLPWAGVARAWEPGMGFSNAVGDAAMPLAVDIGDRNDVVAFYQCMYIGSSNGNSKIAWTGSVAGADRGTTADVFKDDVRRRINWFRAMAEVPADIEFDAIKNSKAQAAALIMSESNALSHNPSNSFGVTPCWTADGQEAAANGNLALGVFGVSAMDGYIHDPGAGNTAVGHRRWLLLPKQAEMGTGDIPSGGQPAANCVYVIDATSHRVTNSVQGQYYAWPPAGFVPSGAIYPRWSLHFSTPVFGSPTFGSATVAMTHVSSGSNIPVNVVHRYIGGGLAGDPTLVWEPDWSALGGSMPREQEIEIRVVGVTPGSSGASTSVTYRVTAINPDVITDPYGLTGVTSPPTAGANYGVTQLTGTGADGYQVGVGQVLNGVWMEGAEQTPPPKVIAAIGPGYALCTNLTTMYGFPGTAAGTNVFHLAFPGFVTQSFEIDRDVVPSPTSALMFSNIYRFSTTVSRLSAEISTNSGATWVELWGRDGVGPSTANWDVSWQAGFASLSAYAGKPSRIRFVYAPGGSAVINVGNDCGCFLDNIRVTDSEEFGAPTITDIGTSSNFTLDASTAGGALVAGQRYALRLRPILGGRVFPFSDPLHVTVVPWGYPTWAFTPVVGGSALDYDLDGLRNGIEYAFGMDPTQSDRASLPGLVYAGGQWSLHCVEPADVEGVTYKAEYSTNLVQWAPLTDAGSGTNHTFTVPSGPKAFVRWLIEVVE